MGEPESTPPTDGIGSIALERIGRYESGQFNEDAAEIIAHSARTDHLYVVNADVGGVDVLDATTPGDPERVDRLVLEDVWADAGEVTNVALRTDVPIEGSDGTVTGMGARRTSSRSPSSRRTPRRTAGSSSTTPPSARP